MENDDYLSELEIDCRIKITIYSMLAYYPTKDPYSYLEYVSYPYKYTELSKLDVSNILKADLRNYMIEYTCEYGTKKSDDIRKKLGYGKDVYSAIDIAAKKMSRILKNKHMPHRRQRDQVGPRYIKPPLKFRPNPE